MYNVFVPHLRSLESLLKCRRADCRSTQLLGVCCCRLSCRVSAASRSVLDL